mgnify:FL=1
MEIGTKTFDSQQGAQWDVKSCVRCIAGLNFDKTCLPDGVEFLPKGVVLAKKLTSTGYKAVLVKTAVVHENAAKDATTLKIKKGHAYLVGEKIAGSTISAIDTSNTDYDALTVGALAKAVTANTVVNDDNVDNIVGLNYARTKMDAYPTVTYTIQAYEIEESTLPFPINDTIKEKLTTRHHFALDFTAHS